MKWGDDLGAEDETLLVEGQDRPVFIYNYPKQAKAFYMKENPADPRTVLCDDLLAPEGYGEIIGGSQREDDHDKLLARIKEEGLPVDAYNWYLDLRKYGTFVHSGIRARTRTNGRLDLRNPPHSRGNRISANDESSAPVICL